MRMIRPEQLRRLREQYLAGSRVELEEMDDVQAPPIGTQGTVIGVDQISLFSAFGQTRFLQNLLKLIDLHGGEGLIHWRPLQKASLFKGLKRVANISDSVFKPP